MHIILGIFLTLAGVGMLFFPSVFYEMSYWWRSDTETDPSSGMLVLIRISGVLALMIAVGCFVYGIF